MLAYYGTVISDHITQKPNGGIICTEVPIARTGTQDYLARELQLDGDPERVVTVTREEEEVFSPAAMASFEGVCVCDNHPPEDVTAENFAHYSKGHVQNIRRSGEYLVGDLHIDDAVLADQVMNHTKREISCGYRCVYEPSGSGYTQREIRGNHVAVVLRGRAGSSVSIHDFAPNGEKEGTNHMSEFWKSFLTAFGMAAKDASPEEVQAMAGTTAAVLDAEPEPQAQESAPAGDSNPAPGLDAKLDRILEMLSAQKPAEEKSPADALGELARKLSGGEDAGQAVTIPAGDAARDAALSIVKAMQPVVASIQDKALQAQVTDALLSAVQGPDVMSAIDAAARSSAQKAADAAGQTSYEQRCADSQAAYAARNPHTRSEKEG